MLALVLVAYNVGGCEKVGWFLWYLIKRLQDSSQADLHWPELCRGL